VERLFVFCRWVVAVALFALVGPLVVPGVGRVRAASCGPSMTLVSGADDLRGVAVLSSRNAWAVGTAVSHPLILHWNGTGWSVQRNPNPSGPYHSVLYGVAATSSTDAWAVGTTDGDTSALIDHWNGKRWTIAPSPRVGGKLYAVSAISPRNVWAVGYDGSAGPLIEHWDGTAWTVQPTPPLTGTGAITALRGVVAISPSDVWAVGYYDLLKDGVVRALIEHWNGSDWTIQPNPVLPSTSDTLLYGVAAASAHNVWVVGDFRGGTTRLIERWNGKNWNIQLGARPGELLGVAAITAKDAWAVGDHWDVNRQTLREHWNGKRWTAQQPLQLGRYRGGQLFGVAAASPTAAWAVGDKLDASGNGRGVLVNLAPHCG
jgi:hypothetical protein